ncbi:hypothetical protein EDC04DRAFT_1841431 [Pisolithus marmoratus]|nr:hypothetical protein EDC04DRAFT_1841431 [Pisolithus marmoratus]
MGVRPGLANVLAKGLHFKRTGNIFEDMRALGIDLTDSAYCSVVSRVSGFERKKYLDSDHYDLAVASPTTGNTYLVLHRPKGISLPANEYLVLLLKALSSRLAGKHLVITIVQCSDFYRVDDETGVRTNAGGKSALECVGNPTETENLTPLCIIASPQVWRRQPACVQRRKQFRNIREHFYTLMDMHQPGTEAYHKSTNSQKERAIKFLSVLFGHEYLRNYIGDIKFFEKLSWVIATTSLGEALVGTAKEDMKLLAQPPTLPFVSSVNDAQDSRLHVVPLLVRRCQVLSAEHDVPHRYADEKQKIQHELKSISQTPCAGLLTHIIDTLTTPTLECLTSHVCPAYHGYAFYDRQLDTHSTIQQIRELKVKFDVTEDDDERRTLEEDITGKILWLCWCGICAEVDGLLPKIVDCIRRETNTTGLSNIFRTMSSMPWCMEPDDDLAHLWRIMFDAGMGTSKHQLLLSVGATKDTHTVPRGTTPSASCQTHSIFSEINPTHQ